MGEVLYISATEWYVNINNGISPNPANPIVVNSAYDPSAAANSSLWRPYAASATGFTFITPISTDRAVETDQFVYINEDDWYLRTGEATTVNLDTDYTVTGWRRLGGTGVIFLQQEGVPVDEDGSTTINFRGGDAIQVVEEGDGVGVITVNAVPSTQRELLSFTWPNTALRSNINGVLGGYTMVLGASGVDFDADTWSLTISETGEADIPLSWDTTTSNLGQADFVRHLADTLVSEYPQYSWDDIVHTSLATDLEAIDVTNPFNSDGGFDLDNGTYRNEWENQVGREVLYITISNWSPGTIRFLGTNESDNLFSNSRIIGWRPADGFDNSSFSLHLELPETGFNTSGSTAENFIKGIYETIATNDSNSYDPSASFSTRLADFYAIEGVFPGATNSTNNAGTDPNAYTIALPWVDGSALFSGFGITQIPILGATDLTNVDVTFSWKINPYVETTKMQSEVIQNGQLLSIVTPASSIFNGYNPKGFQGSSFVNVNIGNTYAVAPTVGDLLPNTPDANQFFYADVEAAVPVTTKTIVQQTDAEGNNLYNTADIDGDSNNRPRYSVLASNDENYIEILEDIKDKWDALDDYSAFREGRTISVRKDAAESFDTTGFSVTIDNQDALIDAAYLGNILTDGTDGDRVVEFEGYTAPVIANPQNSEDSGIDIKTIEIFGIQYGIASDGALVDLPNTFEATNIFKSDVVFENNDDNGSDWDALEIYKNREDGDPAVSQEGEDGDFLGSIRWQSNNDAGNRNPNSSANISVRDVIAGTPTANPNVRLEMDVRNTGSSPTKLRIEGGNSSDNEFAKLWFGDEGGDLDAVIALNRKFDLDDGDIAAEYLGSRLGNGLVSSFSYGGTLADTQPKIHGEWWHRPALNELMGEITFRGKELLADTALTDFARIEVVATELNQATSRIELAPYTQGTKTTTLTVAHDEVVSNADVKVNGDIEVNKVNPSIDLKTTSGNSIGEIKFSDSTNTIGQIETDTLSGGIFNGSGRTKFSAYNSVSSNLEEVFSLKAASVVFGEDNADGSGIWGDITSSSATFSSRGDNDHTLTQTAIRPTLAVGENVTTRDVESNYRNTDDTVHITSSSKGSYERFNYFEDNSGNFFLRRFISHNLVSRTTGIPGTEEVTYFSDPYRFSLGKPIRMANLAADPADADSEDGDIYYRDAVGSEGLRVFDNGTWSDIGGGGGITDTNFTTDVTITKLIPRTQIRDSQLHTADETSDISHIDFEGRKTGDLDSAVYHRYGEITVRTEHTGNGSGIMDIKVTPIDGATPVTNLEIDTNQITINSGLNTIQFPGERGTDGQVLTSNGSGLAQWEDASGGSEITVQEEGSSLATAADTLNFVGASVTASGTGATKTITVADAGTTPTGFRGREVESGTPFGGEVLSYNTTDDEWKFGQVGSDNLRDMNATTTIVDGVIATTLQIRPSDDDATFSDLVTFQSQTNTGTVNNSFTNIFGNGIINQFNVVDSDNEIDYSVRQFIVGQSGATIDYQIVIRRLDRSAAVWVSQESIGNTLQSVDGTTLANANTAFELYDSLAELSALTYTNI